MKYAGSKRKQQHGSAMLMKNVYVFYEYECKQKYENHVSVFLIAGRSQHCHTS